LNSPAPDFVNDTKAFFSKIDKLIDGWCERRCLKPLRFILRSYPLAAGLTDEWASLLDSLKDIKGFCGDELTAEERRVMVELINVAHDAVYRESQ
jgi:hypothetical protein